MLMHGRELYDENRPKIDPGTPEESRQLSSYYQITSAVAEGINYKIMSIKRRVGGFRNRQKFQTAIFFFCGGHSLCPQ